MKKLTIKQIDELLAPLSQFMGQAQTQCVRENLKSDETLYFQEKMVELAARIHAMPKTYEQDGMGDKAIVTLHYFKNGCDWWITEKDIDSDHEGQLQAFGLCILNGGEPELGYVSIQELLSNNVELDFHFTPCTLAEVKTTI